MSSTKATVSRFIARTTWHPDKWERLSLMAERVPAGTRTVLDVGGRAQEMAGLLAPISVTTVNVQEPADVVVPVGDLPFDDDSYDVITSCDVLEHMAEEFRPQFMANLLRVARNRVVLCCPWGSPEKDASELRLAEMLEQELGVHLEFLDEHIEFGLPREADVLAMIRAANPDAKVETLYQEDIADGEALLMDGMRAKHRKDPKALARYLKRGYLGRRRPELHAAPSDDSHRLFVVIDLP